MKNSSTKRVLLALGGMLAAMFLVVGVYLFWGSWVSPFERSAMLRALGKIDQVGNCIEEGEKNYDNQIAEAQNAVNLAERRAFSGYDHQLLWALQMHFDSVKAVCKFQRKAAEDSRYAKALQVLQGSQADEGKILRSHLQ